jgi:ribosome-associated protein
VECGKRITGGFALEPIELSRKIVNVLEEKLGEDILLLDIRGLSLFADFFVICSGSSDRQLRALVDSVREMAKKDLGILPHHVEGGSRSGWVLIDYVDIVVHIFTPELRAYYDLEGLWHEGKVLLRMQ